MHKDEILEDERDEVESVTGMHMTADELYMSGSVGHMRSYQDRTQAGKKQHDANLHARVALKSKKL